MAFLSLFFSQRKTVRGESDASYPSEFDERSDWGHIKLRCIPIIVEMNCAAFQYRPMEVSWIQNVPGKNICKLALENLKGSRLETRRGIDVFSFVQKRRDVHVFRVPFFQRLDEPFKANAILSVGYFCISGRVLPGRKPSFYENNTAVDCVYINDSRISTFY